MRHALLMQMPSGQLYDMSCEGWKEERSSLLLFSPQERLFVHYLFPESELLVFSFLLFVLEQLPINSFQSCLMHVPSIELPHLRKVRWLCLS
jgi:hypothetical protein